MKKLGKFEIIDMGKADNDKIDSCGYTVQICARHGIFGTQGAIVEDSTLYEGIYYTKTDLCNCLLGYINFVRQILEYKSRRK